MRATWMAAGALAVAGVAAAPTAAQAGVRVGVGITVGSGYRYAAHPDPYRIGYDRGLQDGFDSGRREGRHEGFNFWDDRDYRRGDRGYDRNCGPRHRYVAGYRQGYEQGYRRSFVAVRHHHRGQSAWGYERHDGRDRGWEDDRIIHEEPRYR